MTSHHARTHGRHRAARHTTGRRPDARGTIAVAVSAATALSAPAAVAAPGEGAPGPEQTPAAKAAHAEPRVPGTPCSASTDACVDLEKQEAWLIEDGEVVRGPMTISSGGRGQETPVGHSFRVYRQEEEYNSRETSERTHRPAPMPYSTFFGDGGIAFHGGDPARSSAGCIRMDLEDAEAVFQDLEVGDKVQVVNGSDEAAARSAQA